MTDDIQIEGGTARVGDFVRTKDGVHHLLRNKVYEVIAIADNSNSVMLHFNGDWGFYLKSDQAKRYNIDTKFVGKDCDWMNAMNVIKIDDEPANTTKASTKSIKDDLSFWDNSDRDPPRPKDSPWEWL